MIINTDRLRNLRKGKNALQKNLASLLKITDRQYRGYEAGTVDPPTSKLIILADYFDVSIDYLVGRTDNPNSHKQ